jgi:ankyrin repeat protein
MPKVEAKTILHAAGKADRAALERLVAKGADLNALWRGYRPLHALIQEEPHAEAGEPTEERLACLEWLIEHGADPELCGAWPPAPALLVAAFVGSRAYVDLLLAKGAKRDLFGASALGDLAAVERALAKDPAVARARADGGLTALQCAAGSRMGRNDAKSAAKLLSIAEALLDAGAEPNALTKSWSHEVDAAYFACGSRNPAMLELLLDRGADATAALPSAAWKDAEDLLDLCLEHGARIDGASHEGKPLLNQLVRWGQVKQALRLLERGASPNVPDERGWTALHQAASRGNERMLRACLERGGDRTARDKNGLAPVVVAMAKGHAKLAAILAG